MLTPSSFGTQWYPKRALASRSLQQASVGRDGACLSLQGSTQASVSDHLRRQSGPDSAARTALEKRHLDPTSANKSDISRTTIEEAVQRSFLQPCLSRPFFQATASGPRMPLPHSKAIRLRPVSDPPPVPRTVIVSKQPPRFLPPSVLKSRALAHIRCPTNLPHLLGVTLPSRRGAAVRPLTMQFALLTRP